MRSSRCTLPQAQPRLRKRIGGAPSTEAYAAEINRVSIASSETMASILTVPPLKKSTAWLIIQTY